MKMILYISSYIILAQKIFKILIYSFIVKKEIFPQYALYTQFYVLNIPLNFFYTAFALHSVAQRLFLF